MLKPIVCLALVLATAQACIFDDDCAVGFYCAYTSSGPNKCYMRGWLIGLLSFFGLIAICIGACVTCSCVKARNRRLAQEQNMMLVHQALNKPPAQPQVLPLPVVQVQPVLTTHSSVPGPQYNQYGQPINPSYPQTQPLLHHQH